MVEQSAEVQQRAEVQQLAEVQEDEPKEYELIYWTGSFAGRGEYVRLMLEVAGKEYKDSGKEYKDCDKEQVMAAVLEVYN